MQAVSEKLWDNYSLIRYHMGNDDHDDVDDDNQDEGTSLKDMWAVSEKVWHYVS